MNLPELSNAARYALAFGLPLVVTLLLTPLAARAAHRFGVLDHPRGHKAHAQATPYLGGVAVAAGLLLVGAFAAGASGQLLTVVVGAAGLAVVGLIDDVRTVGPVIRVACETAAGISLWLVGIRAGVFGVEALDLVITVVWVVAITNAFNLIDNMDGLAAGIGSTSALGVALVAGANGHYLVTSLALGTAGASLGFLRYNFPPAKIFLGDAGALLIGYLVAALTLHVDVPTTSTASRLAITTLLVAVPLLDLVVVVVDRLRGGRTLWLGGTDHTSHRLKRRGASPAVIAGGLAAIQMLCSIAAFLVARIEASAPAVFASSVVVGFGALVALLGLPPSQERAQDEGSPDPTGASVTAEPDPRDLVR